jgi:hypothetical protein
VQGVGRGLPGDWGETPDYLVELSLYQHQRVRLSITQPMEVLDGKVVVGGAVEEVGMLNILVIE